MRIFLLGCFIFAVVHSSNVAVRSLQDFRALQPTDLLDPPNGENVEPRLIDTSLNDGAQRKHVAYGTYAVSSAKPIRTVKKANGPCPGEACLVTAIEVTAKYGTNYTDAKEANEDTGFWLGYVSILAATMTEGNRAIFAAGNERPTVRLNKKYKYGIEMPEDIMVMLELVAEDATPKNVTLFISYDYVLKSTPGYKAASVHWVTIGSPVQREGVYKVTTKEWVFPSDALLLYTTSHMLEGGTDMRLFLSKNTNAPICTVGMHYQALPNRESSSSIKEYISAPGSCTDFGRVSKGDSVYAEAWFDTGKHPVRAHNGTKMNAMGNMLIYVGPI